MSGTTFRDKCRSLAYACFGVPGTLALVFAFMGVLDALGFATGHGSIVELLMALPVVLLGFLSAFALPVALACTVVARDDATLARLALGTLAVPAVIAFGDSKGSAFAGGPGRG